MALFKRILRNDKRKNHRWTSGHLELGLRRERERQITEQISQFKQWAERQGVVFGTDRDAWEAYWEKNPRAHMELVGASLDEVVGEKAFDVFKGFWLRVHKDAIMRVEGDGEFVMPTLTTIGSGNNRMRVNPAALAKSGSKEERALSIAGIDQKLLWHGKVIAAHEMDVYRLQKIRDGLQSGATVTTDPDTGVVIIQGMLAERVEGAHNDAE